MDVIKIFFTIRCNFRCDYCFVHLDEEIMAPEILDNILTWGIKNNVKRVILTGGEPTSSFDLIVRAAKFMKRYTNPDFKFDGIPTNGTQLTRERIYIAKSLNLKFIFSLDGYAYESNMFRHHNRELHDKIIDNLEFYAKVYGKPPKINLTVPQENAHELHENVLSLLRRGYTKIHICPEFGRPWGDKYTNDFLESFEKLLVIHRKFKQIFKDLRVDPIDLYCDKIRTKDYEGMTQASCDVGSEVAFSVKGEAYACLVMLHLQDGHPLRKEYYLGDINKGIDLEKMRTFKNYNICSEFPVSRKFNFPNISCRKVYATVNFHTGERMEAKYIENLMKIEYTMFQRTYETYFKKMLVRGEPRLIEV